MSAPAGFVYCEFVHLLIVFVAEVQSNTSEHGTVFGNPESACRVLS